MLVVRIILLLTIFNGEALSQVAVPYDCKDLAKREGFPTVTMSEKEVAYAESKLAYANKDDPLVSKCIKAIERIRAKTKPE